LKKRTKKLLTVKGGTLFSHAAPQVDAMSKSFLLLFFKKEVLPSFTLALLPKRGQGNH
jgi:hypothetical protein